MESLHKARNIRKQSVYTEDVVCKEASIESATTGDKGCVSTSSISGFTGVDGGNAF